MPILAIVPPCAGECRLVRVTGVLIFANSRTCVGCVLPTAGPPGHRAGARLRTGGLARARRRAAATTHRPVGRPVAPGAIAGMTLRNERSVRLTPQTTHNDAPMPCQGIRVTFSGLISGVLKRMVNGGICWVADKTGKVHSGEGKLLLGRAQQGRTGIRGRPANR
jgi:hypothetical protein